MRQATAKILSYTVTAWQHRGKVKQVKGKTVGLFAGFWAVRFLQSIINLLRFPDVLKDKSRC
jgi:hypothetical protein